MTSAVSLLKFCEDWAILRMVVARALFENGPMPVAEFYDLTQAFDRRDLLKAADSLSLELLTIDGCENWRLPSNVIPFLQFPPDDGGGSQVPCGVAA